MEFAFSALLLLILILPGFILQFTYTRGFWRWNSPNVNRPLTEQIPTGVVYAAVLHLIWASIWANYEPINLKVLIMLLIGNYGNDEEHLEIILKSITDYPYHIAFYFLSLYLLSAILGYIGHSIVRKKKLDLKTRFFRFNNEWFYSLRGEVAEFNETPDIDGQVDGVMLTTVVHHGEKVNYLYRGFVYDFFFDKEGNLDRVVLMYADRRDLSNDKTSDEDDSDRFYEIVGNYFIIRYSEMTTINLYYITFEPENDAVDTDIEVFEDEETVVREPEIHDT